jgi:hypothetical protein
VVSREQRADRLAHKICDLPEAQPPVVPEVDDLPVSIREAVECGPQTREFAGSGVGPTPVHQNGQISGVGPRGLSAPAPDLVADAVHRDPEQPGLEPSHFHIAVRGPVLCAVPAQLGCDCYEHGLGHLFSGVEIATPTPGQRENARAVPLDQIAPRGGLAARRGRENIRQWALRRRPSRDGRFGHDGHPRGQTGREHRYCPWESPDGMLAGMPVIAYTVTATFPDDSTAEEYIGWLKAGHLEAVITAGASSGMIVRVQDPAEPVRVETRYLFPDRRAFDDYLHRAAPALRAAGLERFGGRGIGFERRTGVVL